MDPPVCLFLLTFRLVYALCSLWCHIQNNHQRLSYCSDSRHWVLFILLAVCAQCRMADGVVFATGLKGKRRTETIRDLIDVGKATVTGQGSKLSQKQNNKSRLTSSHKTGGVCVCLYVHVGMVGRQEEDV